MVVYLDGDGNAARAARTSLQTHDFAVVKGRPGMLAGFFGSRRVVTVEERADVTFPVMNAGREVDAAFDLAVLNALFAVFGKITVVHDRELPDDEVRLVLPLVEDPDTFGVAIYRALATGLRRV